MILGEGFLSKKDAARERHNWDCALALASLLAQES